MKKSTQLRICGLILLAIGAFRIPTEIYLFSNHITRTSLAFDICNFLMIGIAGFLFGMAADE